MIQAPIVGRPRKILPVASMISASVWLLCSLYMERIRQISSAIVGVCVSASEKSIPASPALRNVNGLPISSFDSLPGWKVSTLNEYDLAAAFLQLGLRIEQIHLARSAVLHELDHAFRARRKVAGRGLQARAHLRTLRG